MEPNRNAFNLDQSAALDAASMDEIIGELDLDALTAGSTITSLEAVEELDLGALDSADLAVVEHVEARETIYADSAGDGTTLEATAIEAPAASEKAAKTKKEAKPRLVRDISALPDEVFVLSLSARPDDLAANKAHVIAGRPTQKKIAEKFDNLLVSLNQGAQPSIYTRDCFAALWTRKTVTSGDLVGVIAGSSKSSGDNKTLGTARSQSGQIMNLFATLEIANRAGSTLTLNPDSAIAHRLSVVMGLS